MLFEGWDASGKGGAIKRLVDPLDPRHVRVASIAAPTPDELRHHWLARFWPLLPGDGGMTVLDRSWYGRVLVERVEGFASKRAWRRAYDEINAFEEMLHAEHLVLVKFWMHISDARAAQALRGAARRPAEGLEADRRGLAQPGPKRAEYEAAVDEMLERTSTPHAPWTVVEAESKRHARVKVAETVADRLAVALGR